MWKNGNVVNFQSKVKERDKIVIKNGESEVVGYPPLELNLEKIIYFIMNLMMLGDKS